MEGTELGVEKEGGTRGVGRGGVLRRRLRPRPLGLAPSCILWSILIYCTLDVFSAVEVRSRTSGPGVPGLTHTHTC